MIAQTARVRVLDTVKSGETHLHRVMVEEGRSRSANSVMRMLSHLAGHDRLHHWRLSASRSAAESTGARQSEGSLVDDEASV